MQAHANPFLKMKEFPLKCGHFGGEVYRRLYLSSPLNFSKPILQYYHIHHPCQLETRLLKPPRLAQSLKASSLLYGIFCRFDSHPGRKASCRCTQSATLLPWGTGTESCSLRAFLHEHPCHTHSFQIFFGKNLKIDKV